MLEYGELNSVWPNLKSHWSKIFDETKIIKKWKSVVVAEGLGQEVASLVLIFNIMNFLLFYPCSFPILNFQVNLVVLFLFYILSILIFHKKLVSEWGLIFNDGNFEIRCPYFGLQHQICIIIGEDASCAHIDRLVHLGFDKMSLTWTQEKKKVRIEKSYSNSSSFVKLTITARSEGEKTLLSYS